ncbi:MAG: sigma 54-interacting transcriptional regulator [Polyangiales bacterium]
MKERPPENETLEAGAVEGATGSGRALRLMVVRDEQITYHPLPLRGEVVIGRDPAATVCLPDALLSRAHLRITLDALITVADLGSRNGTRVRREPLEPGSVVQIRPGNALRPGDLIEAGASMLFVQAVPVGAAVAAPPPRPVAPPDDAPRPLVRDPSMERLYELLARVADGALSVLLLGETGVGKEFAAEHVHRSSRRARGPFLRLNCAALADSLMESELFGHERGAFTGARETKKGLLESAAGGTVFLDEVGELPMSVQVKLLRVLEERKVTRVGGLQPLDLDVRVVAATNRDLDVEVASGRFRQDLFFRLNGVAIEIPPLRSRPSELIPLAMHFLAREGRGDLQLTPEAVAALRAWRWPGNVRELRNVMARAALLCGEGPIRPEHLAVGTGVLRVSDAPATPPPSPVASPVASPSLPAKPATSLREEFSAMERQRIVDALQQCMGNQTRAAKLLGMPRRTFVARLDAYGIPRPRKGADEDA